MAARTAQTAYSFVGTFTKTVGYRYLLFLPKGHGRSGKKWPAILFLHGAGERGSDISRVRRHGVARVVEEKKDFPFVVVSPQCPEGETWQSDALLALLDDVTGRYDIDPRRVCLTGLSMGGYGTWALATEHPERFAAIAPVCGGGFPLRAPRLKGLPAWVFHGALDPVVPIEESVRMVRALRLAGGDVKFTVYPTAEHDSWTEAYGTPELYRWFLKQRARRATQGRGPATCGSGRLSRCSVASSRTSTSRRRRRRSPG